MEQIVQRVDVQSADFRSQGYVRPQARVVRDLPPPFAHTCHSAYLAVGQVAEGVQDHLIRELLYSLEKMKSDRAMISAIF